MTADASRAIATWHSPVQARKLKSEIAFRPPPGRRPMARLSKSDVAVEWPAASNQPSERLLAIAGTRARRAALGMQPLHEKARDFNLGSPRTTNVPIASARIFFIRGTALGSSSSSMDASTDQWAAPPAPCPSRKSQRPTLDSGCRGRRPVAAHGSAWVEEDTGRVFEAEVRERAHPTCRHGAWDAVIRVSFAEDAEPGIARPDLGCRKSSRLAASAGAATRATRNFRALRHVGQDCPAAMSRTRADRGDPRRCTA